MITRTLALSARMETFALLSLIHVKDHVSMWMLNLSCVIHQSNKSGRTPSLRFFVCLQFRCVEDVSSNVLSSVFGAETGQLI